MKKNRLILALLYFWVLLLPVQGQGNWMSRGAISVSATGTVETILPMDLHRASSARFADSLLDLSLVGPDGNLRAFELFWRAAGEPQNMILNAQRTELQADKRVLWETSLSPDYKYSNINIEIEYSSYAGKVDAEGMKDGQWFTLATGLPIQGAGQVAFPFPETTLEKVRFYFSGYDKNFAETPIFVKKVAIVAQRQGSDYAIDELAAEYEQTSIDGGVELRVFLPGSGIKIQGIEISTSAQFKGTWKIGHEKIVLGKRDFQQSSQADVVAIGKERQKFLIDHQSIWESRVILLRLTSEEFFGKVEEVKIKAVLPRMVFMADQTGEFQAQTGMNKTVKVLDKPVSEVRQADQVLAFAPAITNPEWQAESLLKGYSLKGGPFQSDGYAWKAPFTVERPGFLQLSTSDQVCLDRYRKSLRIIKDDSQVPYFMGREELRELDITVDQTYEADNNRTVYLIKLPQGSAGLAAVKFSARGIFERTLVLEKHVGGEISWQPWQKRLWANDNDKETVFTLPLFDFPEDQYELRMTVEHGSNQALAIDGFKGLFKAQDLFFVATEPGNYQLVGGNPTAGAPVYDLAIVQDQLLELAPEKIFHGSIEMNTVQVVNGQPVDQGAPFNNSGYDWMASFTVPANGFFRLALNQQAALDNNRDGLRLVRNGIQVPYFAGKQTEETVPVAFSAEYEKNSNTSFIVVELPAASKNWLALHFQTAGVFIRNAVLEIRKPGRLGWQTFTKLDWTSRTDGPVALRATLDRLPDGEKELRLVIPHGDNRPLEISSVKASYRSQELFFHANDAGEYQLYGGNSKAKAPIYDLALIKNNLLKSEPKQIKLGEASDFKGSTNVQKHLEETFSETGWGLYLILGLVTALLLVMIVKLFPEDNQAGPPTNEQK